VCSYFPHLIYLCCDWLFCEFLNNPIHPPSRVKYDPTKHIWAVKRILRYLSNTKDFGQFYPNGCPFELVSYSDAEFGGCKSDRKSTSDTFYFIGQSLVSWFSKKQNCVSLSTSEAEYISAALACTQVLYMQQTLRDFGIKLNLLFIVTTQA